MQIKSLFEKPQKVQRLSKSSPADAISGVTVRSDAPHFLQKREPVSVEPHSGQTELWAASCIRTNHILHSITIDNRQSRNFALFFRQKRGQWVRRFSTIVA